jgi:hypothetical protein
MGGLKIEGRLSERGFVVLLTLFFAALCLLGILHHELWRDEMQTWLVARDSLSITHLFQNLKYETGHSFLWHLCLFGVSRFTRSPLAMQLFHWLIAIAAVYLIARFAPFSRLQRTLLVLGYFPLYEYGIISRNYAPSLLCLVAFCILFPTRHKSYLPLALILFFLENTNSYSLVLAVALGMTLVVDYLLSKKVSPQISYPGVVDRGLSLLIWLGGVALGLKLMLPPADGGVTPDVPAGFDLPRFVSSLAIVWKSYFPIPGLSLHFWNTNIIDDGYAAVLSLLVLPFAIVLFVRKPVVFFLFCLSSLTLLWFSYSRFLGVMRHWGYLFLIFFVCLWLSSYYPESAKWGDWFRSNRLGRFFSRYQNRFLMTVLTVQVIAALLAFSMDLVNPFSEAKATAQFIQQRFLGQVLIAGDDPFATLSVSGYLDRPLYYPSRGSFGTYAIFDNRNRPLTQTGVLQQVEKLGSAQPQPLLLVLNYRLNPSTPIPASLQVAEVKSLVGAIVKDENFYIYEVKSRIPSASSGRVGFSRDMMGSP